MQQKSEIMCMEHVQTGMRSLLDFVDTSLLETCVLHATETSDHVDQTGMKNLLDFSVYVDTSLLDSCNRNLRSCGPNGDEKLA